MKKKEKKVLALTDIKEKFFVRVALDESRVAHFIELKLAEVKLPALLVGSCNGSDELVLIDGRHRKIADERLGNTSTECELEHFQSEADMIVAALQANVGGSLPPKPEDITHAMQLLLAAGVPRREIISKVSERIGFPPPLVAKHVRNVQSMIALARLRKAVQAVAKDGATVNEAAVSFDVSTERLKKELLKGNKVGEHEGATDISQAKAWANKKIGSLNHSTSRLYARISRDLGDGLITQKQAEDVLDYMERLVKRVQSVHEDWKKRILARQKVTEAVHERDNKDQAERGRMSQRALSRMGL